MPPLALYKPIVEIIVSILFETISFSAIKYISFAKSSYIVAVGEFIRQKYPNAIVDDILIPTYKLFVDDVIKKEIVYSTNDDVKQNLLDRFSQDDNLSQTILNSYFKAYVDRREKPKK